VGIKSAYDCVKAFSETDLTDDLRQIDVPTLIVHGDDDQIVPIQAAGRKSIDLVKDGRLSVHRGAPHGLTGAHEQQFNAELLEFLAS
jgi:non-heme chloroperoxidase